MPFPLSFGTDTISVPFVVLMSWKLSINLFSSADFSGGKSVWFCAWEVCSTVAVLSCLAGLSSCGRAGGGGWLLLPQSRQEVNYQASSSFLPIFVR